MSTIACITVRVRFRWWLKMYLAGVKMFCAITGCEPDMARVEAWVRRGLVTEVVS